MELLYDSAIDVSAELYAGKVTNQMRPALIFESACRNTRCAEPSLHEIQASIRALTIPVSFVAIKLIGRRWRWFLLFLNG